MIELQHDNLVFTFPEVHPAARLSVGFQRTLRIPDDDQTYPLPPGLGEFPLRHVDDFADRVSGPWLTHGGVMLPMYQSEALWLNFHAGYVEDRGVDYPFAIKIATGKINAVTGKAWSDKLRRRPQDYVVSPEQPWLDGYCVEKGFVRQFVAMPLGSGYSAEEQLTGEATHGGLQLIVYPMRREEFERRFPKQDLRAHARHLAMDMCAPLLCGPAAASEMGLAPGGRMRQEIYDDPYRLKDWDKAHSRCFVHIANSLVWRAITGDEPPTVPPTASEYNDAGLPWFDYYSDAPALPGADALAGLHSVAALGQKKGDVPLPDNAPVTPTHVVELRAGLKKGQVREGRF